MVMVRVSETYDLSTKVGRMGIVGIHTPRGNLIDQLWPGLILQHKKFRFVKCDVAMACASMLPADPLQVGVEAGAIAPQDMFNPILYKAVSNDSMNQFLAYINTYANDAPTPAVDKGSIVDLNDTRFSSTDGTTTDVDQFSMYYGLLADADGWKKSMPQAGLAMNGLYPLVYQLVSPYGQQELDTVPLKNNYQFIAAGIPYGPGSQDGTTNQFFAGNVSGFRGASLRMPAIDTVVYCQTDKITTDISPNQNAPVQSNVGSVPTCYVGLIILPPAKLNQLYYRLKVTWTIEFSGLRSMADIGKWMTLNYIGQASYGTDYAQQSKSLSSQTSMVDAGGATVEKVMEGV